MKTKIIELLKSTGRPEIDNLINHMEEIGFFTAPCSGGFHLCKVGGLMEHSLNVYEYAIKDFEAHEHFSLLTTYSEVTISALLHDLGKASYHGKPNYVANFLASGKRSESKPFETNKDILMQDHAFKSCMIASKFIELTEDEEFALLYHNGLYVSSGRDIQNKERPLQLLIHNADMQCCRFIEKE